MSIYMVYIGIIVCVIAFVLWYTRWYAPSAGSVDNNVSCIIEWNWGDGTPVPGQQPQPTLTANSNFYFITYGLSEAADGGIKLVTNSNLYSSLNIVSYTYKNFANDKNPHIPKIAGVGLSKNAVPYGKTVKETLKNPISMSFGMFLVPGVPIDNKDCDFQIQIVVS